MKNLFINKLTPLFIVLFALASCNGQTGSSVDQGALVSQQDNNKAIIVYYYHGERRCATCKAVGNVSKQAVEDNFSSNPNVIFRDINIEEPENREIKERFELSGSGLFVFDGQHVTDLTAFAFQKAAGSPEELSDKLVNTVNGLL